MSSNQPLTQSRSAAPTLSHGRNLLTELNCIIKPCRPSPLAESLDLAVDAIAWMLRRGMSRLQDTVLAMFDSVGPSEVQQLLVLSRRALNSYEDFWRQVECQSYWESSNISFWRHLLQLHIGLHLYLTHATLCWCTQSLEIPPSNVDNGSGGSMMLWAGNLMWSLYNVWNLYSVL